MDTGVGFRFHPTDEELVNHYLKLKMRGYDDEVRDIPEVNVVDYEPWQLPNMVNSQFEWMTLNNSNDQVWYFFCPRNYRYSKSQRITRTTNAGYWKITGKDRKIKDIGVKKTLVFYRGRVPTGIRTNWVMHEYNPTCSLQNQRDFVICKLKKKPDGDDDIPTMEGQSSGIMVSGSRNDNATEEDFQLQAHVASFKNFNEMDYNLDSAMQWSSNYYNY